MRVADGAHVIDLDDGSTAEGHVVLAAVGREVPLDDIGLEHYGLDTSGRTPPYPRDGRLRIADGLYAVGDAAGPELHTHQAHYQGELAARMAHGEHVTPDYRALPRATYTDPEAAFVGVTVEAAKESGLDAFELVADFPKSSRGYAIEAKLGHITIVVDRATRELVGAAMACPDASAAIHECVLAIQAHVTVDVLAETIHAFPSTSRIFNGLFADALKELERRGSIVKPTPRPRRRPFRPSARSGGRVVDSGPPGVTGSSIDAAGITTTSARWPTVSRPRSGLSRRDRRVDAVRTQRAVERQRLLRRVRWRAAGQRGSSRRTASASPGHGSYGSTGASVPNGMTAPVSAIDSQV